MGGSELADQHSDNSRFFVLFSPCFCLLLYKNVCEGLALGEVDRAATSRGLTFAISLCDVLLA